MPAKKFLLPAVPSGYSLSLFYKQYANFVVKSLYSYKSDKL